MLHSSNITVDYCIVMTPWIA